MKILEKGRSTYIGISSVEGELLIEKLMSPEYIPKKEFFIWCHTLCGIIHAYHKARKTTFKYITPYSLVVDKECNIHLLDLESVDNQDIKAYLHIPLIKKYFAYPDAKCIYPNKYLLDYYSLAKTIQFIISQVLLEPNLSKKELKKLRIIVERCQCDSNKKTYKSFKSLQSDFKKIYKIY